MYFLKYLKFNLFAALIGIVVAGVMLYEASSAPIDINHEQVDELCKLALVKPYLSIPPDQFVQMTLGNTRTRNEVTRAMVAARPIDLSETDQKLLLNSRAVSQEIDPIRQLMIEINLHAVAGLRNKDYGYAFTIIFGFLVGSWILALLVDISWRFILARIREVSLAVRGQKLD